MPFGLQPIHLVVIVIVALLIFGPRRLPQIGKWLARTFSELRRSARDMADGFRQETAAQEQPGARRPGGAEGPSVQQADAPRTGPATPSASPSPYPETAPGNYCTSCGASNASDARFCNKCGTRLPT